MSHEFRLSTPLAAFGALVALAAACGHSEAFIPSGGKPANGTPTPPSTGGSGGSGGSVGGATGGGGTTGGSAGMSGAGGSTGGAGGSTGGSSAGGTAGTYACTDIGDQRFDPKTMPGYTQPVDPQVETLFAQLSPGDRIKQTQGIPKEGSGDYQDIERSPDVDLGGRILRGYRYRDAGHGVNLDAGQDAATGRVKDANNFATAFPQSSSRGASWDLDLEWRLGEAMGDETAASKNNMLLAPCMNIIRHPYWGRTQETYGEDTYHIGRMASAYTAGLQQHVAACAKHYAANNVEKDRANQDAIMDEQTLREIYTRHFEMVVRDGGVSCVMASYNKINGKKSTQNHHLLTEILRNDYGYRGTVISDWWAMPGDRGPIEQSLAIAQASEAIKAGLDIEVPWTLNYGSLEQAAAQDTEVSQAVDTAAKRILEQKFRFKTTFMTDSWSVKGDTNLRSSLSGSSIATNQGHLDLAEEAEIKSAVLLANGLDGTPVLPLPGSQTMAVVGLDLPVSLIDTSPAKMGGATFHMSTDVAVGDRGSSRVNADPAQSVGPWGGISQIGAMHGVTEVGSGVSANDVGAAEVAVVVVGYTPGDEGEEYAIPSGGDRTTLDLPGGQNDLVNSVLDLGKPTIIIIQSGSIVNLPWLNHPTNKKQATIWAGYGGMRAGLAYAKLIFGDANFSGKMPMAWPTQADQDRTAFKDMPIATTMGYFFGYRLYDNLVAGGTPINLVFPFGHGLSYSTFTYGNLMVPCTAVTERAILDITVDISNTSAVPGEEVALLFVKGPTYTGTGKRAVKELKSFAKVKVDPMGMATAHLPLRIQDLRHWEGGADGSWVIDKGTYTVMVGKSGADSDLTLTGTFTID